MDITLFQEKFLKVTPLALVTNQNNRGNNIVERILGMDFISTSLSALGLHVYVFVVYIILQFSG